MHGQKERHGKKLMMHTVHTSQVEEELESRTRKFDDERENYMRN
jgi:hypothetical protein